VSQGPGAPLLKPALKLETVASADPRVRHRDLKTTLRYRHVSSTHREDIAAKLGSITV